MLKKFIQAILRALYVLLSLIFKLFVKGIACFLSGKTFWIFASQFLSF